MNKNSYIPDISSKVKSAIEAFAAKRPEILSAYLFGSVAQELAGPASDIDIAIRCVPEQAPEVCFELKLDLMGAIETALDRSVDVVILNSASLHMVHQVLRKGLLLYATDTEEEAEYAIRKQKEYFDFRYYLDKDRDALKSFYGAL